MNLFKEVPPQDNILDLMTNHAEALAGIEECKYIISILEAYRMRSEVEDAYLNDARVKLYQFKGHKEMIYAHLRKFLN